MVFLFQDFFTWDRFQRLYWICYSMAFVLCFDFLTTRMLPHQDQPALAALEVRVLTTGSLWNTIPNSVSWLSTYRRKTFKTPFWKKLDERARGKSQRRNSVANKIQVFDLNNVTNKKCRRQHHFSHIKSTKWMTGVLLLTGGQVVQALGEDAGRKVTGSNTQKAIRQFHVSDTGMPFAPVMILQDLVLRKQSERGTQEGLHKDSLHS